ncbi:MAG TPA: hypothetical protein VJH23_03305 [archaeon]|nr:hypothetical protein [archaeon]
MLSKGFVGPIGDDLPSLIPLLFGLVIFFSTFTLAFNAFDARNADFKDDLAMMRISRTLQSNSYIYNYNNFHSLCDQVGPVNLKFIAGISPDAQESSSEAKIDIYDIKFFKSGGDFFYCSNIDPLPGSGDELGIGDFLSAEGSDGKKIVTRIFPIVVEDNKIVRPMHLYVVAWK